MSRSVDQAVVVGVDGEDGGLRALRYAVHEINRTGTDDTVRLVHVGPDYVAASPVDLTFRMVVERSGREMLAAAAAVARELAPELRVTQELYDGPRAATLARTAEGARMIVLGRTDRSLVERVLGMATTAGVAARATCPVVCVPAGWPPLELRRQVVVGFKSPHHAPELLRTAFAEAATREARLVVLHAWKLPGAYDDLVADRVSRERCEAETRAVIEPLLAEGRRTYPEVEVDVQVVHEEPGRALVEHSAGADLLVLVRRAHGFPAATHLGGAARTLLRWSDCPVMVVAPHTDHATRHEPEHQTGRDR
ncbi:universal stress protein [Nocardioides pacificus]